MPWKKGESGNPKGLSRQAQQCRNILDVSSPALMRKGIKMALATGTKEATEHSFDMLKLLVGRIVPQQIETKNDHSGSVDVNLRAIPSADALLAAFEAEWEEQRALDNGAGAGTDGSVLPAEVHTGSKRRTASVAVLEDKRSRGKS